jgi:hypothetical protein
MRPSFPPSRCPHPPALLPVVLEVRDPATALASLDQDPREKAADLDLAQAQVQDLEVSEEVLVAFLAAVDPALAV